MTLAKFQTAPSAIQRAPRLAIRRKIMMSVVCGSILTASLGAYAIRNVIALSTVTAGMTEGAVLSSGETGVSAAGDGFQSQQLVQAEVAGVKLRSLFWTCGEILLGLMIAMVFARRVVAMAFGVSAVACHVAAQYFEPGLSRSEVAESGAMLATVDTMRANIVAMTALEAAGRKVGKPMPTETIAAARAAPSNSAKMRKQPEAAGARSRLVGAGISF